MKPAAVPQKIFDSELHLLVEAICLTYHFDFPGARSPLSGYYTATYGLAVFDKSLRKQIVFSDHSLAIDSVFAEVHLVSCRNVLIYFVRTLQDRALKLFSSAVRRGGGGGITVVQNPDNAMVPKMPAAALRGSPADYVLTLDAMVEVLKPLNKEEHT